MRHARIIVAALLLVAGHANAQTATGRQTISSADNLPVTAKDVDGTTVSRSVKARLETLVDHTSGWVSAKTFGVKCDATWNGSAWVGTDDTAKIQRAIDYAIYPASRDVAGQLLPSMGNVTLPSGACLHSNTIHVGYGVGGYSYVRLAGTGRKFRGEAQFGGTALVNNFCDRPAVNIQGARQAQLSDLTIIGRNYNYLKTSNAGIGALGETFDSSVGANWVDPAITAACVNADSRYAPYVGVAIDAYSGTGSQSPKYPDATYPAFLGVVTQWTPTKNYTDIATLDRVEIQGFVGAFVTQPSGADANGDFISITDSTLSFNRYDISVSQTQMRQLHVRGTQIINASVGLTNFTHGAQNGMVDGLFESCSYDQLDTVLTVNVGVGSPITFVGGGGELIRRLGTISAAGNNGTDTTTTFRGTRFRFADDNVKPVPTEYLATNSLAPVVFDGAFISVPRVFAYTGTGNVRFENTVIWDDFNNGAANGWREASLASRLAENSARSIFPALNTTKSLLGGMRIKSQVYPNVGSTTSSAVTDDLSVLALVGNGYAAAPFSRNFGVPAWAPKRSPYEDLGSSLALNIDRATYNLTGVSTSGVDFTFDITNWVNGPPGVTQLVGVGDLVYDDVSKVRAFITGRTGNVVTMRLLTGYSRVGGTLSTTATLSANTGNLWVYPSRVYTTGVPIFCDVTSGSLVLTNCMRGDGFTGAFTPGNGDVVLSHSSYMGSNSTKSYWSGNFATVVSTVAGAFTLDKTATVTVAGAPFGFWLRPIPGT